MTAAVKCKFSCHHNGSCVTAAIMTAHLNTVFSQSFLIYILITLLFMTSWIYALNCSCLQFIVAEIVSFLARVVDCHLNVPVPPMRFFQPIMKEVKRCLCCMNTISVTSIGVGHLDGCQTGKDFGTSHDKPSWHVVCCELYCLLFLAVPRLRPCSNCIYEEPQSLTECGKYFSSAYSLSTVVQPVTQSQTLLLGHLPDLVMVHKRNLVGAVQGP